MPSNLGTFVGPGPRVGVVSVIAWLIVALVVIVVVAVAFVVLRRRRRGGGVIATRKSRK